MTIAIAWVRKLANESEELLIVADSRLSGGMIFDCCPKIMTLPRSDSAICFAGDTNYAYPLMLQLYLAIDAHSPLRDRSMDIHEMRSHALKVFNSMRDMVMSDHSDLKNPNISFILGGYSWERKLFSIWHIHFKKSEACFAYRPAKSWIGDFDKIVFVGDWAKEAEKRLIKLLQYRYNKSLTSQGKAKFNFNMEPFEVVRDILRENAYNNNVSIGGPPQLVKVYQHMNTRPIAVYWPNRNSG